MSQAVTMDKIVAFCKRRGFVYQSSEIYGGIRSSYDYGPLGVEMKRNIKEEWWRSLVHMRDDVVGWTRRSSCTLRCGRPPGTRPPSTTCSSRAAPAGAATGPTTSSRRPPAGRRGPEPGGAHEDHRGRRPDKGPRRRRAGLRPGPALQPDVRDVHGAGQGPGERGVSEAGDGAGDLRELQERLADEPGQGAVRDRPAGQVFPERDHTRQLHLPHPRVRADGDGVLRRAGHGRGVARVLARAALELVHWTSA